MVFITARSVLRQISAFLRLLCWNRYKKAGTQVLEPYLSFILFAPQEYLSRAYHDAVKYDAVIETTSL
jgi:translation elongation factor EF-G